MMLEKLCPILPSADIDRAEAFWASIGFQTLYKDNAPGYLLMKRDAAEVQYFFDKSHIASQSNHGAYLRPSDVNAFSAEVEALGLPKDNAFPKFAPAEDKPWGMREAALWDPDGNLIRAGQEIANWPK